MKREKKIYGNCRVYHPDGSLMFLCLEKKTKWYTDRNLADVILKDPITGEDLQSLSIKLNFEPGGRGAGTTRIGTDTTGRSYYLSPKYNKCVVCGSEDLEDLTKHHVVPSEYRKYFPEDRKSRSSHDIVVICNKDHRQYENMHATKLKKQLEKNAGASSVTYRDVTMHYKVYNMALLMLDLDKVNKIPADKIEYFLKEMKRLFGTDDPFEVAKTDIHVKMKKQIDEEAKRVVENLEDIDDFIVMWREHFINHVKPKFMPEQWSIYHNIEKYEEN
jgi:hypothetical protein